MSKIVPARKFRRTSAEILRDRTFIAELHLVGASSYKIAEELAKRNSYQLDPSTIRKDIAAVEEQWRESAITSLDRMKVTQAERLKKVMNTAWEAWEASKKPSQERTTVGVPKGGFASQMLKETRVTTRESCGNVAYLQIIESCITELNRLLGLHTSGPSGGHQGTPPVTSFGIDPAHAYQVVREEIIWDLRQSGCQIPDALILPPKAIDATSKSVAMEALPEPSKS